MSDTITTTAPSRYPLVAVVEKQAERITPYLPKGVTLDQIGHAVQMMALKQPELLQCTGTSLAVAISRGLRAGLEIGETWHLLTFKNKALSEKHGRDVSECTGVADYKGLAQLMIASGAVRYVDPDCVYEGDAFTMEKGLDKKLLHIPASSGNRGKMIGAYVVLTLPFGVKDFHYMSVEDIDAIRLSKSRSWKNGPCPPWYAKKTVIRQIAKLIPKDKRMAAVMRAVAEDEASEFEDVPEAEVTDVVSAAPVHPRAGQVPSVQASYGAEDETEYTIDDEVDA